MDQAQVKAALTGPVGDIRTPFLKDGNVDYQGLKNIIDFNLAAGCKTALLTAGDSHFVALTQEEIAQVTRVTVEHVRGRAMVVAADRYYHTAQAVEFARYCRGLGVDVLMTMPPDWGHSCTPQTLAEHYTAVSREISVMLVTNIFIPRGAAYGMETLKLALDIPNIVAVKDDFCGDFGRRMALLVHDRWAVYSGGLKSNHLDIHPYGCDGYLSTLVSFVPRVAHAYWAAIQSGDILAARKIISQIEMPWFDAIASIPGGFDAGMHAMLEIYGLAGRWRRKPYATADDAHIEKLRTSLKGLGLL